MIRQMPAVTPALPKILLGPMKQRAKLLSMSVSRLNRRRYTLICRHQFRHRIISRPLQLHRTEAVGEEAATVPAMPQPATTGQRTGEQHREPAHRSAVHDTISLVHSSVSSFYHLWTTSNRCAGGVSVLLTPCCLYWASDYNAAEDRHRCPLRA